MWNSHRIDIFLCLPLLPAIVLGLQKYHILRKQETFDKTILNYTKLRVFRLISSSGLKNPGYAYLTILLCPVSLLSGCRDRVQGGNPL